MSMIITVINQKGGVGKSTTAWALGHALMEHGKTVLFVDLDAQGNLSHAIGADSAGLTGRDAMGILTGAASIGQSVQQTENGDIVAGTPALAGADLALQEIGKEYRLREALSPIFPAYDYILIDTPPSLGILTVNALTACSACIIPAQADVYSLQGIQQVCKTIEAVRTYCNPFLQVHGILLTRFTPRTVISRDMANLAEAMANTIGTVVYPVKIRESTVIKEAQATQRSLYAYAPRSHAAQDYFRLGDEIIRRGLSFEE